MAIDIAEDAAERLVPGAPDGPDLSRLPNRLK